MRFKSNAVGGYQIYAVAGINTVSFGIDFDSAAISGLLGFAIEREDPAARQRYYMYGFKVFRSIYPHPGETLKVTTFDQPVQSFVWDDFTAKPGRRYIYHFHPIGGTPKNIDRSAAPISITIETESLYSNGQDVFFNRGVASSQAYAREFDNKSPDKITDPVQQAKALQWLSRDLDEALFKFIDQAESGDTLLGAFYEFRYRPAADRFKAALDRGVDVRLVIDAKDNSHTDKMGVFHEAFPRKDNMDMVAAARLPSAAVTWRERNPDAIAHNKFMVLLKGKQKVPAEVWTGSTNLSMGGIHGQTNVGHWVRDPAIANHYAAYWSLLQTDPGTTSDQVAADKRKTFGKVRADVAALLPTPIDWKAINPGTTAVFSPRAGGAVLDMYAALLDESKSVGCITLAFGISDVFKGRLVDNDGAGPVTFLLLEKPDEKRPNAKKPFVPLTARNNVYKAWGSYLKDPLYRWTRETNAMKLGLNAHVSYIHSKFLLHDPLCSDPIVVTGSANFSDDSTNTNDENMLIVRGNTRVADIYFTEFNRLFFHYYFRSVREAIAGETKTDAGGAMSAAVSNDSSLFLDETTGWVAKYAPNTLRLKRLKMFTKLAGAVTL